MDFFRKKSKVSIFSNLLSNESEIRNKRCNVCGGTNKLPNVKKKQCSTFKIATREIFSKISKIFKINSKTMHSTKKSHE